MKNTFVETPSEFKLVQSGPQWRLQYN